MITLKQAAEALNAQVACGDELLNREVRMACGSDMMSDVLAYAKNKAVLLTGLLNIQVVRTADVSDVAAIVFVRDKHPETEVLMAAKNKDIPVLYTKCTMFEACGRLYTLGLRGCTAKDAERR
jgi:predicted transcriptional regulator